MFDDLRWVERSGLAAGVGIIRLLAQNVRTLHKAVLAVARQDAAELTAFGDRLGPGTADAHIVPPARRNLVSRQANIVIVGGVVSGTWSLTGDQVVIAWFPEARPPAREELAPEAARLAAILDLPSQPAVQMT
jgi:hypothetical protein